MFIRSRIVGEAFFSQLQKLRLYYTAMIIFHLILHPAVHIYDFHIFITLIIILSRVCKNEPIQRPAPSWLLAQLVRALHRYRRDQGFEYRASLNFFFRLSFRNCKKCVYNFDDHLSSTNKLAVFNLSK